MANGCFETEVERQLVAVVSLLQCAESQVERRDAKFVAIAVLKYLKISRSSSRVVSLPRTQAGRARVAFELRLVAERASVRRRSGG